MGRRNSSHEGQSRILIVEDEILLSKEMERHLKALGYRVVGRTGSGEEAVEIAKETKPDLVLMDIKLNDAMDGIEAARLIQRQVDTATVYLTGYSDRSDLFDRAKVTEPYAYLSKPISPLELVRTVETALYKHGMKRELRESRDLPDLVINALPVGVVYVNTDEVLQFVNKTYEGWCGLPDESVKGRSIEEVLGVDYRGTIRGKRSSGQPQQRGITMGELLRQR